MDADKNAFYFDSTVVINVKVQCSNNIWYFLFVRPVVYFSKEKMSKAKLTLFDDDDEEDEEGDLQINKTYAAKYEEWRRGEEIAKCK